MTYVAFKTVSFDELGLQAEFLIIVLLGGPIATGAWVAYDY